MPVRYGLCPKPGTETLALNNTETYTGPTSDSPTHAQVNGQLGSGAVTVSEELANAAWDRHR